MSAQTLEKVSGLVAMNSLMAMVGGTLVALVMGKNDPGFVHNGPLAGLVAVCAGSDLMHPLGALALGGMGGVAFMSQLLGTLMGVAIAFAGGFAVYGALKKTVGIRLDAEEEFNGADLSIHQISSSAERETLW